MPATGRVCRAGPDDHAARGVRGVRGGPGGARPPTRHRDGTGRRRRDRSDLRPSDRAGPPARAGCRPGIGRGRLAPGGRRRPAPTVAARTPPTGRVTDATRAHRRAPSPGRPAGSGRRRSPTRPVHPGFRGADPLSPVGAGVPRCRTAGPRSGCRGAGPGTGGNAGWHRSCPELLQRGPRGNHLSRCRVFRRTPANGLVAVVAPGSRRFRHTFIIVPRTLSRIMIPASIGRGRRQPAVPRRPPGHRCRSPDPRAGPAPRRGPDPHRPARPGADQPAAPGRAVFSGDPYT